MRFGPGHAMLAAGLVACCVFWIFNRNIIVDKTEEDSKPTDFLIPKIAGKIKDCILAKIDSKFWDQMISSIQTCVTENSGISASNFTVLKMGRYGERKLFLLPEEFGKNPNSGAENCSWVTIGIGGDTNVEKEFKQKFGDACRIFGIEAQPGQELDFAKYGTVIPLAIGLEPGQLPMTLRNAKGGYGKKTVQVHPLHEVIQNYTGSKTIHLGTLDIEAFEYRLMTGFKTGSVFTRNGLRFCQLDVEFHQPWDWKPRKEFKFEEFFAEFLNNSQYVPIWAENLGTIHKKVTLVDGSGDKRCRDVLPISQRPKY